MRVPLSWLREFTPVDAEPGALADRLSISGFAVEEMVVLGRGISGIVVGEVRAMREHPNADSLMLVRAFDGTIERDIVCGARNYAVGDRVPFALPGARLPNGMEIAQRVVRGETSDGMLCSARELGISEDHSGILILDRTAKLGADLVSELELDDIVYDLDVTTNRPDALSIVGIAREVAALYKLPLTVPEPSLRESGPDVNTLAQVTIEDARGCPRYLARVIEGVTISRSPWWMQRRLLATGMRPISNVVDVTNYVLLERGQPLHAFDLDRLAGRQIVVRKSKKKERIRTLDGVERDLARDDVLICDADGPVAIAGIMGGGDSEVNEKTTRLLLESAYFDPIRIRPTARRLGLRTEASTRFERGADPEGVPAAAARAAQLFAELSGGTIATGAIDVYPRPVKPKPIRLRLSRTRGLIGLDLEAGDVAGYLRALGCVVEASKNMVRATPPTWRPDLGIEEDLVEEVARLHGYDQIPEGLPPGARTGGLSESQRRRRVARDILLGTGLNEALTQSLIAPGWTARLSLAADHVFFAGPRIGNPLSVEESVLRPSLLPGLLSAAQRNASRRVLPVRLFEIGTVFHTADGSVEEHLEVAWILSGPAQEGWHRPGRELDFFDAKGALEALAGGLGVDDLSFEDATLPLLHPGRTARIRLGDDEIGLVAELTPHAAEMLELPGRVAFATLQLSALIERGGTSTVVIPPRLPSIDRDVALVVPVSVHAAQVAETVRRAAGELVEDLKLFDVYRGAQVGEGMASLAFSLTLRDPERTLTDSDADGVMTRIADAARAEGWTLRS